MSENIGHKPKKGDVYKHFKGHIYEVIAIALDSDTLEEKVVYKEIGKLDKIWVRGIEEFTSKVDKEKYPDIDQEYRFELL
jgi:hypothetical protein